MKSKSSVSSFESAVGRKLFLLAGICLIIFGLGYFIKYSFDKNLIPPFVRIILAYAFSSSFLFAGEFFRRKEYSVFGNCLAATGIAGLYSTTYGAYAIYNLFPASAAMVIFSTITVFSSVMSVLYNTVWLAHISCAGGFVSPFLISATSFIPLMLYIMILDIGILYIAVRKQWLSVQYSGFAATWFVFFTGIIAEQNFILQKILFLALYFAIFSFVPLYAPIYLEEKRFYRTNFLLFANAVVSFILLYITILPHYGSKMCSLGAVVYSVYFAGWAAAAYYSEKKPVFTVTIALSAVFAAISIPLLFAAYWISVFWAFLGVALLWIGIRLNESPLVTGSFGMFMLSAFRTLFTDTYLYGFNISQWSFTIHYADGMIGRILYYICIVISFLAAARLIKNAEESIREKYPLFQFYSFFFALASCLIECSVLKQINPSFFHPAFTAILAGFAILFLQLSLTSNTAFPWLCGTFLLGNSVFKMFFYDIRSVIDPATWSFNNGFSETLLIRYIMYVLVIGGLFRSVCINKNHALKNTNFDDAVMFSQFGAYSSLFLIANIEVLSFFHEFMPVAQTASISILWGILSYIMIWRGLKNDCVTSRKTGIVLCCMTILKVLFIDMSNYATPYRILSAILTGLILVSVSFQYHKLLHDSETHAQNENSAADNSAFVSHG